ncbi:NUDIX domain-containing protein [Patescibacteria group bacterium]|nr:NUDIX domain-containing protein [Patescibacteria group bacterium]MBU1034268.1 NUDIX domain-containing protein [Patescibacteria group bacterium]MBU1630119.1 NUDIX domain-containing protein [Patescibacteria group bacterium]MBU1908360.1 NUDIX domain-containing protein [Patescibacteria group bacterium]
MAYFNKAGLLIRSKDGTGFLVCVKNYFTSDFILPGGKFEKGETDQACLKREIKEELSADLDDATLVFLGEYTDVAAGDPTKDVSIRLFEGKIIGTPVPTNEIIELHWLTKGDISHPRLSPILKNKILPDLITRGLL